MTHSSEYNYVTERLEELRKKLLDLTGRNRLLNFKHRKTGDLRVVDEIPDQLCEELFSEKELRFLPVSQPSEEELITHGYLEYDSDGNFNRLQPQPDAASWAKISGFDTNYELQLKSDVSDKHNDRAIQTLLYPEELESRLRGINNRANSSIEETGTNILYLSFGFLKWFEVGQSSESRLSPLFLVPVVLSKGKLDSETQTYPYTLSYSGEDVITNMSLSEKLRQDLDIKLPEIGEDQTPSNYFQAVTSMINKSKKSNWKVESFCTLTLLNFSKMLMYLDLDPSNWPDGDGNLVNHEVIKKFFTSSDEDAAGSFEQEYEIDEIERIDEEFPLIDDADSSQHSALIDAIRGKNLVIEGPPGTGKSQTITNLIAAALGQGKTVLFVAEKLAALEVVKRRLDKANLGDFCLELHSHKTQKRKVLEDLRIRTNRIYTNTASWEEEIEHHAELRSTLKEHADLVNAEYLDTGKSIHEILMTATRYRHELGIAPEDVHPSNFDPMSFSNSNLRKIEGSVKSYGEVYELVLKQLGGKSDLTLHPWYGLKNENLQHFDAKLICSSIQKWNDSLNKLDVALGSLSNCLGVEKSSIDDLTELRDISSQLSKITELTGFERLSTLNSFNSDLCVELEALFKRYHEAKAELLRLHTYVKIESLDSKNDQSKFKDALTQLRYEGLNESRSLESIFELDSKLKESINLAKSISSDLSPVFDVLPKEVVRFFDGSLSGYKDLLSFFQLVIDLDPMFHGARDEFFEQEVLDRVLLDLAEGINTALPLKNDLRYVFDLDVVKDVEELIQLESVLSKKNGLFAWFHSDWREARRKLHGLSASTSRKYSELFDSLPKLIEFGKKVGELFAQHEFEKILGDRYQGLDTEVEKLIALRTWYRVVRAKYGVGFGPKVVLGNSLISLPTSFLQGIRSLKTQGIFDQLQKLIDSLERLAEDYGDIEILSVESASFLSDEARLNALQDVASYIAENAQDIFRDTSIASIHASRELTNLLELIKEVESLKSSDLISELFSEPLLDVNEQDPAKESVLKDTLSLAKKLIELPMTLSSRILSMEERSDFDNLATKNHEVMKWLEQSDSELRDLEDFAGLDLDLWAKQSGYSPSALVERNNVALEEPDWMAHWISFYRFRNTLCSIGFESLIKKIEDGDVSLDDSYPACMLGVYDSLARHIFHNVQGIARFASSQHTATQQQFQRHDHELKQLQQKRVAWKCSQRPVPEGISGGRVKDLTEMALIRHETGKKTRHIPIRKLVSRSQRALVALKPCFMMGPMSVAQYLDPGELEFDLLIMDEASQIKPEDALGSIARAKQVVIVGDPKQLPPTSFFDRLVDDGGSEDASILQDSESILESVGQLFDYRRLRWHYRSQHESLIKFSNMNFYDGDLVLFPSPNSESDEFGVKFKYVSRARFVNGRNVEEAKAVAEGVAEHLKTRNESIGVVAMNAEQRDQIERAFEELQKRDVRLQSAVDKNSESDDPLFFKNLENVQGDERDVIYISFTYGPQDYGGGVHQRFGPINSENGWRRLNVLLTRSRKRMHVYSSMNHTDIVPSANSKEGVLAFRNFLEYAETGRTSHPLVTGKGADSDFEIDVASALYAKGYECEFQVGAAGYFIDLAVRDPGNPGRFLMGIECDGATYHSAKSVRDRDRLRQEILEGLGWEIRRIWSTDWFANPQSQLNPILDDLEELRSEPIATVQVAGLDAELDESEQALSTILQSVGTKTVEEALKSFDRDVISKGLGDVDSDRKLLSSSMIDALIEFQPISRSEFTEVIPKYLRSKVAPAQGKYLDQVLEIIENYETQK